MASESHTTISHATIKKWAEERGGHPATVKQTAHGDEVGVLRINFPGYSGENTLEQITWDEFFAKFDEKNLSFLYQVHTSTGEESRFFKFISRESAEHATAETSHSHEEDEGEATAKRKAADKSHSHQDEDAHTEHKTAHSKSDDKAHKSHKH